MHAFDVQTLGSGTGPVHLETVCFVWRGGSVAGSHVGGMCVLIPAPFNSLET